LKAAEEGRYELVVSERLLEELRGVLMRRKFRRYLPGDVVPAYLDRLRALATLAQQGTVYPRSDDPKDD
jgi:predicted nucleic acid-binding protein